LDTFTKRHMDPSLPMAHVMAIGETTDDNH